MKWTSVALALLGTTASAGPNPIRKVVTLLQNLQKEIEVEGEKEDEMHKKMDCYCKQNREKMATAQKEAGAEAQALAAKMAEQTAQKEQTQAELKEAKSDREKSKEDLGKATAIREKELAVYEELIGELKPDLDSMDKAIAALNKGMGTEAFIQADFGKTLKKAVSGYSGSAVDADDREAVISFLEGGSQYAPASGQIVGIIMNMKDEMTKDLKDEIEKEDSSAAAFVELKAAKEREIAALSESIENKIEQVGHLALAAANSKAESGDAADQAAKAAELAQQLEKQCASHGTDYNERVKSRGDELAAIADTIKYLNSDEALDLFKASMGKKQSFLQKMRAAKASPAVKARTMLLAIASTKKATAVSMLAATAAAKIKSAEKSGAGFDKIIKLVDDMVVVLKKEQQEDEKTRDWCTGELDTTEEKLKEQGRTLDSVASKVDDFKAAIESYTTEIETLHEEIKDLNKAVKEASEQRKEENAEFVELKAMNEAAATLIGKAKNRLNKFYNPAMHQKAERRDLTSDEKMAMAAGGEDPRAAEEAQAAAEEQRKLETGSLNFVQIKAAQEPEEEEDLSLGAAPKMAESGAAGRGQKNNAIMSMMDTLVNDLKSGTQQAEHEEKTAQQQYEKFMVDSTDQKKSNEKSIVDKEGAKAETEVDLQTAEEKQETTMEQNQKTAEYLTEVHAKCDFIIKHFDMRREARGNEIDGLKNAKAVLSGASYE